MYSKDIDISLDLNKQKFDTNIIINKQQPVNTEVSFVAGGGIKEHNKLKNLDMENQHPITAITDLSAKLTELSTANVDLQDKISAETLRATAKEVELETSLTQAENTLSDRINTKQDILVNQENIKSVNNQSLLGSGNLDIDNVENITYSELVDLKTNSQLKKGLFYRITDYVTTTNGNSADSAEPSRSAGHPFDIIVQALGPGNLSEICSCALHEGDTYFATQNLGAWQVWYDINNDDTKYGWAVTDGTGKGVIYRMIDEYKNDFPYDFKNIQFYRDKTLAKYSTISAGMKAEDGYYYTVTDLTGSNNSDLSLLNGDVYNNKMDAYTTNKKVLNNIVSIQYGTRAFINNKISADCYNNTFAYHIRDNTIGIFSYNNVIGFNFTLNTIDGYFRNNIVGTYFYGNHIAGYFQNNVVKGTYFEGNNVGEFCSNNNFSGKNYAPYECNIGANFRYNTIGDDIADVTFENNMKYVNIPAGLYQATIKSFLRGASATNLLDLTGIPTGVSYNQTIEKDINGRVLTTWSDLGVTKGKYKESVTATEWLDLVSDYYTKTEIDAKLGEIETLLEGV